MHTAILIVARKVCTRYQTLERPNFTAVIVTAGKDLLLLTPSFRTLLSSVCVKLFAFGSKVSDRAQLYGN